MDVYFRSCPRDVRVTTLIFIPSLNTKMSFIMLEKGIFLESFSMYLSLESVDKAYQDAVQSVGI
jgi:hypothetical protein